MSVRPVPLIAHVVASNVLMFGYAELVSFSTVTTTGDHIQAQKGGLWPYLTVQALFAAVITSGLSVLNGLLPKNRVLARAKRLTEMIALPMAVAVSGIYWSLILFAPHLILPPAPHAPEDSISPLNLMWLPLQLDITIHLLPAVFLTLDFYLLEGRYSKKDISTYAPIMAVVYTVWYVSLVEYLNLFNHQFPYPFLNVPVQNRLSIYAGATLFGYMAFRLLNSLHPGKPLLGDVEVVQKVVEPTSDRLQEKVASKSSIN